MRPADLPDLPEWPDRACRGEPVDRFFQVDGEHWTSVRTRLTTTAEQFCAHCPIRTACRRAGRVAGWGLWGGRVYRRQGGRVMIHDVLTWGRSA